MLKCIYCILLSAFFVNMNTEGQHIEARYEGRGANEYDSLNACEVGNWSEADAWTLSQDAARNIVFVGSCGCVYILDVSVLSAPKQIGKIKHSLCNTNALFYDEDHQTLYVCSGMTGLSIWSVSDPSEPVRIGYHDTQGCANGVYVKGSYAYVADGDNGLCVIDISRPSRTTETAHFDMTSASSVRISEDCAYITDIGLRILDISNPLNPREVSYYETPGLASSIQVIGSYAYVADDWCGLRIIDVSDPKHPAEVGHLTIPGFAWDIHVSGSYAYIAACDAGLRIIDISEPKHPREVAYYDTPYDALFARVSGPYVYVATAVQGLQIYANVLAGMAK